MEIAFYAPMKPPHHPVPSGDRRIARLFIDALHKGGHSVRLMSSLRSWTRDPPGSDPGPAERIAERARLEIDDLTAWCSSHGRPDIWFTYHLYHKAPDHIGPALCRRFGIPYAVAEASYAPKRAGGPWDAGHRAVGEALAQASVVFALNPGDIDCIRPQVSGDCAIVDLPPFLDPAPFRTAAGNRQKTRARLAANFGLDPERPWIAVTAMMRNDVKRCSYRFLSDALRLLPSERRYHLLAIGDGPARAEVEGNFAGLPVTFLGEQRQERIPVLLTACDLAAWPSIGEAFGLGVLEAQAAGLPVISCENAGVANMVRQGETARLTPAGDHAAFSKALDGWLSDPVARQRAGSAAIDTIAARHSLDHAARLLTGHLAAAVAAGGRS